MLSREETDDILAHIGPQRKRDFMNIAERKIVGHIQGFPHLQNVHHCATDYCHSIFATIDGKWWLGCTQNFIEYKRNLDSIRSSAHKKPKVSKQAHNAGIALANKYFTDFDVESNENMNGSLNRSNEQAGVELALFKQESNTE